MSNDAIIKELIDNGGNLKNELRKFSVKELEQLFGAFSKKYREQPRYIDPIHMIFNELILRNCDNIKKNLKKHCRYILKTRPKWHSISSRIDLETVIENAIEKAIKYHIEGRFVYDEDKSSFNGWLKLFISNRGMEFRVGVLHDAIKKAMNLKSEFESSHLSIDDDSDDSDD